MAGDAEDGCGLIAAEVADGRGMVTFIGDAVIGVEYCVNEGVGRGILRS